MRRAFGPAVRRAVGAASRRVRGAGVRRAFGAVARLAGDRVRADNDEGSAVVEFLGLVLLLVVPLVYLVLVVGRLQAGAFAAEAAAFEAARVFVASDEPAAGASRALAVAGVALADQGFDDDPSGAVAIACSEACLTPGSDVTVDVVVRVPLPFVPPVVRGAVPLEIPVAARRTAAVDEFREAP